MLSSTLHPLYKLMEKKADFIFDAECREAFALSKELIFENQLLVHYDPNQTIVISCDASSYGVGGVLSHRLNGVEKPICFVSGTLSKTEQNYSQLEREALAIIFSVKKFHKYIYGRSFILVSDHQPLKIIFNPNRSISVMSASRIIRWNVILSAYDYEIEYRKGSQLVEADMLSRLPLLEATEVDESVNSFTVVDEIPISYEDVARCSRKDIILVKVMDAVKTGWPNKVNPDLKPFYLKRNELSIEGGCLMVGSKVVIPSAMQTSVLNLIHENHIGIVRAKMLARSLVWWPHLQCDIERMISNCSTCQLSQNNHEKYLVSWPKTENVFQRVHIDFFYRNGIPFLLIVDSKSKWIDIHCMSKGFSVYQTIDKIKLTWSIMGLPETIVSDNGPPFNSEVFLKFCRANGVNVLKSPPYHPQSNGSAERHVQIVKRALDKFLIQKTQLSLSAQIADFLFSYRNTPSAVTGYSPNEMLFKVKPKTRLDLLKPKKGSITFKKQFDEFAQPDVFSVGEVVLVGSLGPCSIEKWKKGTIAKNISAVTYLVKVEEKLLYKHANSLRKVHEVPCGQAAVYTEESADPPQPSPPEATSARPAENYTETPHKSKANNTSPVIPEVNDGNMQQSTPSTPTANATGAEHVFGEQPQTEPSVRRSGRVRKPPQRLDL